MIIFQKQVNWTYIGSTFLSFLSILSVAPYSLGDVALLIPTKWKSYIFIASSVSAMLLRFWDSRKTVPVQTQPPPPHQV